MLNILIQQNCLLHYRKSLYNLLAQHYNVTILHSGEATLTLDDVYNEMIVPVKHLGIFYIQSALIKIISNNSFDAVILMFDLHWISNILFLLRRKHLPIILWGHRYSQNRLINKIKDYLISRSDAVILYSNEDVESMTCRGIPEDKIFVAPNTIQVSNAIDGSNCPKNSFVFVGRAQKRKKVEVLIKAFSEVINQIPDDTIINIIGSGEYNNLLQSLAKKLKISDRIIFHGEVFDEEKLIEIYHQAYAYISPGHVGLGVLQSFSYGIPVVTCSQERHAQEYINIVDQKNSLFYKTYDELKSILIKLCTDNTLSSRLGSNAYRHYIQSRHMEHMVSGFRKAINKVIPNG